MKGPRPRLQMGLGAVLAVASLASRPVAATPGPPASSAPAVPAVSAAAPAFSIAVNPAGPTEASVDSLRAKILASQAASGPLQGTRHALLSLRLLDPGTKSPAGLLPSRYEAVFFDYTHDRAYVLSGSLDSRSQARLVPAGFVPDASPVELDLAIERLRRDPEIGPLLSAGKLRAYPPMPPLDESTRGKTGNGRIITVGLLPLDPSLPHRIVGVNLVTDEVRTWARNAPNSAITPGATCGPPGAGQSTTARGTAGEWEVVVSQGPTEIWRFRVVRPSASSGTRSSGVELKDVSYKGRKVLARAHVPILNVKYVGNACGPYRDWQWQESAFVADGTDLAPGIRQCTSAPTTVLDSGNDSGTFRGVAIWQQGLEVYLVSEMEAGWYRYLSMWTFSADGTIRPRFGFDGVANSCICNIHQHHAYWRLDFDVDGAAGDSVYERKLGGWQKIVTERSGLRDRQGENALQVQDGTTRAAWRIVPGPQDGTADTYAGRDWWVLRAKDGAELDDGVNCTSGCATEANLEPFVNGDSVDGQDVVVWYGATFVHDESDPIERSHVVGPDIVKGD